MRHKVLTVAVLLALLVPASLFAQEEVTLKSLAEAVQAIQSDFTIFARELRQVNTRVDTVEERLTALEAVKKQAAASGEPCIIIAAAAGGFGAMGNQLRPETLNAYLNKFGKPVESVAVKYARYMPQEDILEVRYEAVMSWDDETGIIERWRQCEFLGFEFDLD